jgi:hypothetical protein
MDQRQNGPFQLSFNASLKTDFQGSRVTSDGGAAPADRIGRRVSKQVEGRRGAERCLRNRFKIRRFLVFLHPVGGRTGPFLARRINSDGNDEDNGSNEGVWKYNRSWPGWQNGNPGLNSDAQACCVLGYRRRSEQQAMVRPRCCLSRGHFTVFNRPETLGALHRPRLRTAAQPHPPANRSCSDRLVLLA